MKRINKLIVLLLFLTGVFSASYAEPQVVIPNESQVASSISAIQVKPSEVVRNPEMFLNKTIKMNAKFDKFSTIGLDYPPALRKSDDYISFMVYRDDTSFDIPQSEMKLFLKRDEAQKFVDLKSKDKVLVTGKVFSTALGDPWVDVLTLETIK